MIGIITSSATEKNHRKKKYKTIARAPTKARTPYNHAYIPQSFIREALSRTVYSCPTSGATVAFETHFAAYLSDVKLASKM